MEVFWNSNLISGLATIITGGVAIWVYFNQKKDSKIQAAKVLLTEIRIAEEKIDQIRDKIIDGSTSDLPVIFQTNSWKKYSHMFVSDFDQDELKLINSFYDYGEQIEEFAKRNNEFFWINVEERGKVTLQKLADIIIEAFDDSDPNTYITKKREFLSNGFDNHNIPYTPKKTLDGVKNYLERIQKITTSSCGIKLKKIAGFK